MSFFSLLTTSNGAPPLCLFSFFLEGFTFLEDSLLRRVIQSNLPQFLVSENTATNNTVR
jgi:hypothetical protein